MRKMFHILMVITVLGGYWLNTPASSYALTLRSSALQEDDFVALSALGLTDELMLGPFADFQARFGIPASWQLEPGATVVLNFEVASRSIQDSSTTATTPDEEFTGATLDVTFNDVSLGVIALKLGVQTLELNIPSAALTSTRFDGRHELTLFLDASVDCIYPHETSVLVRATSGFTLPHQVVSPTLDLNILPKPIYQLDSVQPEPLVVVLPDQPTPPEIQAALIVSAGFGRLTSGLQILSLQSLGELTDEQKKASHLIFVGKAGGLPVLGEIDFPAAVSGASIAVDALTASDGVVQMALSPWNSALSVMYVGGGDDVAVVKSAQALSSGQLRAGLGPAITVITNVANAVEVPDVDTDRTLEMLGYASLEASGVGFQSLEYNFYVPFGQVAGPESYFDMVYSHSALIDFQGSGVLVEVNGQIVGSLRLTDETAKGINTTRFAIPAYVVHPGINTLTIQMEFVPLDLCSELNRDGLWLTIHKNSMLHLPLISAPINTIIQARDLNQYPALFTLNPTLDNLAFIMPMGDSQSWNIAAQIVAYLGKDATGAILNPAVAFGDAVSDEIRQTHDLIIVGRATQLPIITELDDALPGPFNLGSDLAIEKGMQVTYLVPEGTDLGYLQLLPAPWNANRTILAVMGSTPNGLGWAGNALVNLDSIRLLRGTFAVVTDTQILTADTRLGLGIQNLSATAVPGDYQTVNNQARDLSAPQPGYRRDILLIAIGIVSVVIILFLFFFFATLRRQKK